MIEKSLMELMSEVYRGLPARNDDGYQETLNVAQEEIKALITLKACNLENNELVQMMKEIAMVFGAAELGKELDECRNEVMEIFRTVTPLEEMGYLQSRKLCGKVGAMMAMCVILCEKIGGLGSNCINAILASIRIVIHEERKEKSLAMRLSKAAEYERLLHIAEQDNVRDIVNSGRKKSAKHLIAMASDTVKMAGIVIGWSSLEMALKVAMASYYSACARMMAYAEWYGQKEDEQCAIPRGLKGQPRRCLESSRRH